MKKISKMVWTIRRAAKVLNLSEAQVCAYVVDGRLKAEKVGDVWLMWPEDVKTFAKIPRILGRPTKTAKILRKKR